MKNRMSILFVLLCVCTLLLVGCQTNPNVETVPSTNDDMSDVSTDTSNNTDDTKKYSLSDVSIDGKSLSEYMIVTDLASNSAGTILKRAIQDGTGAKIILQCSVSDMGYYSEMPYIYIATLPINGEVFELNDDEAIFFEERGNFKIILGSRKITEADAVDYFLNTILTSNTELKGFSSVVKINKNEILASSIEKAEEDANDILNADNHYSAVNVTGNGKCYYVSFSQGNDSNDGLSPEKAWKTISKVNDASIPAGSVVLFKRGDVWRLDDYSKSGNAGYLFLKSDVIYSSYGAGNKPAIYGSPRDAAKNGIWTETDTKNVWKYSEKYIGMSVESQNDVGNIFFNQGEAYGYKMIKGKDGFTGTLGELNRNFEFWYNTDDNYVYLYYDVGNPGDVFDSIEIGFRLNLVRMSNVHNVIFDNFSIKYGGAHGIAVALSNNLKITNCEIAWMGGGVYDYSATNPARYGNGIELNRDCEDIIIDGNYIYQIYDAGLTHQYDSRNNPDSKTTCYERNINYINNVIENCFYGIEYFVSPSINYPETERYMENINISGNSILYSGYGWGYWRPVSGQPAATMIKGWHHVDSSIVNGTISVVNNCFILSKHDMFCATCDNEADIPNIENNRFIQYKNNKTVTIGTENISADKREIWSGEKLAQNQYLRDKNNTFITVE